MQSFHGRKLAETHIAQHGIILAAGGGDCGANWATVVEIGERRGFRVGAILDDGYYCGKEEIEGKTKK